jgi:uncharacterized protein YecE (DUF72 family)
VMRSKRPLSMTHLGYYAGRFSCVEVNSSFYRPHRATTYARWRDTTPEGFRFAVKMPRTITHEQQLRRSSLDVKRFFAEIDHLRPKLGAVLVQLPPRLEFDSRAVRAFFKTVPRLADVAVVCEPRHSSWFTELADETLRRLEVSRVAADPARCAGADNPGGATRVAYYRWHGSPRMYYSAYSDAQLTAFAARVRSRTAAQTWCIFDNTADHAAWADALRFKACLRSGG